MDGPRRRSFSSMLRHELAFMRSATVTTSLFCAAMHGVRRCRYTLRHARSTRLSRNAGRVPDEAGGVDGCRDGPHVGRDRGAEPLVAAYWRALDATALLARNGHAQGERRQRVSVLRNVLSRTAAGISRRRAARGKDGQRAPERHGMAVSRAGLD